jgi:AraC-like DNA-binding protein
VYKRQALAEAKVIPGVILRVLRDPPTATALAAWLPWAAPDGVIAFATAVPSGYRTVSVCSGSAPGVRIAEDEVARLAARHLTEQCPASLAVIDAGNGWSAARAAAFIAAAGAPVVRVLEPDWDGPVGRRRIARQLARLPRPVGCFAGNDRMATMVAEIAGELVLGRDLLLVGADDDELSCRSMHPPLSSVQIPWERVGREALRLLHRRGQGVITVPPLGVAVRGSSDALACSDPALAAAITAARCGAAGVDDLAAAAGLHRRSFERRCQQFLHFSPLALLHRARLDRARVQLMAGATVESVARSCGWTTRMAFSAAFRQATGETPGAWRARRR